MRRFLEEFLLFSCTAAFVTGATLVIDGGKLAGTPPFVMRQR